MGEGIPVQTHAVLDALLDDVFWEHRPDAARETAAEIVNTARRRGWESLFNHTRGCRAAGCYSGWPDDCRFVEQAPRSVATPDAPPAHSED